MKVAYTPEISLGSVLQIIAIIGSVFSAYVALRSTDVELQQRLNMHDTQIVELKDSVKTQEGQTRIEIKEISVTIKSLDLRMTQFMIDQSREKANDSRARR